MSNCDGREHGLAPEQGVNTELKRKRFDEEEERHREFLCSIGDGEIMGLVDEGCGNEMQRSIDDFVASRSHTDGRGQQGLPEDSGAGGVPTPPSPSPCPGHHDTAAPPRLRLSRRCYFAVRFGCNSVTKPPAPLRSAIFLRWEDAQHFVFGSASVEYASFESIEDAEEYLRKGLEEGGEAPSDGKLYSKAASIVSGKADALIPSEANGAKGVSHTVSGEGVYPFRVPELESYHTRTSDGGDSEGGKLKSTKGKPRQKHPKATQTLPHPVPEPERNCDRKRRAARMKSKGGRRVTTKGGASMSKKLRKSLPLSSAGRQDSGHGDECSSAEEDGDWDKMHSAFVAYKKANNGSISIPKITKSQMDIPGLRMLHVMSSWRTRQLKNLKGLSSERVKKLKELGFQITPPWDKMFKRLEVHKEETGSLEVALGDDEELHKWIKEQKKTLSMHFQGKPINMPNERIHMLKTIGYGPTRPGCFRPHDIIDLKAAEAKWDSMLEHLRAHKDKNGGVISFPSGVLPKGHTDRDLKLWVLEQKHESRILSKGGKSKLTARRIQALNGIGFDLGPKHQTASWEDRMDMLRRFKEETGHCRLNYRHPQLGSFVKGVQQLYKKRKNGETNTLTDERVRQMEELGFVFKGQKQTTRPKQTPPMAWEDRFQQLLDFKAVHGHTVVPQLSGTLGGWVKAQRIEYKRFRAGEKCSMTVERALKLNEVGFCFDASDRFCKSSRSKEEVSTEESSYKVLE